MSPVVLLMVCYLFISEKGYRGVRLDVVSLKSKKKYKELQLPINGYNKSHGDKYLEWNFGSKCY